MDCPHCARSSKNPDDLQAISGCQDCQAAWLAGPSLGPLYRDNLIFLPFARHLAEEDGATDRTAA